MTEANRQAAGRPTPSFRRGEIWMVDFGNPTGTELAMEHPALIVSIQELNNNANFIGRLIVVPATSTQITNAQGKTIRLHQEVAATVANGLAHKSYFMSEQVRAVSVLRFRRYVGNLEADHLREIESRLCLVMGLFR